MVFLLDISVLHTDLKCMSRRVKLMYTTNEQTAGLLSGNRMAEASSFFESVHSDKSAKD